MHYVGFVFVDTHSSHANITTSMSAPPIAKAIIRTLHTARFSRRHIVMDAHN